MINTVFWAVMCVVPVATSSFLRPDTLATRSFLASDAFSPIKITCPPKNTHPSSATTLSLFWFLGKDDDSKKRKSRGDGSGSSDKRGSSGFGGVAQVMDSMETFKKAQQVGEMTGNLVQDLGSIVVEGSAADGKVRVVFDGQQRPKSVDVDETYANSVTVDDLNAALTAAMQDAYAKSREKVQDKMKAFYVELGLPATSPPP